MAAGGSILGGGLTLVGERGPEILALPGGATISPSDFSRGARVRRPKATREVRPMDPNITVEVHDYTTHITQVDGREIGRATAKDTEDRMARNKPTALRTR